MPLWGHRNFFGKKLPKNDFWEQNPILTKKNLTFDSKVTFFEILELLFNHIFLSLYLELEKVSDHFQNPQIVSFPMDMSDFY